MHIIFHVDVNSAFLSWSAVKRLKEDPDALDLRTVPSVICGDVETRHGIVTAKSIPAKRYGIETAEPVMSALRKCPTLILEKSDFTTYREYSRAFIGILKRFSEKVEQASIDEAYVDMGQLSTVEALMAAHRIKDTIRDSLGFTVNVGMSTNKLLAKMASDFSKPDKVHTLWRDEVPAKLWPLEIGLLYGCGGATAAKLRGLGIYTIGEAAHTEESLLQGVFGEKKGTYLYRSANGLGSEEVHTEHEEAKSYSNETTLAEDITEENYDTNAPGVVKSLAESVSRRMSRDGMYAQTIGIMAKSNQFVRYSRQVTLPESTQDAGMIEQQAQMLLNQLARGEHGLFAQGVQIRLIGVSATKLDKGEYRQINLFDYIEETDRQKEALRKKEAAERAASEKEARRLKKTKALEDMMGRIRTQYGKQAVMTGKEKFKSFPK